MTREKFAAPWKTVAERWEKYYTPPGRPSHEDCRTYKRFIEQACHGMPGRVLVLGATPEIRNLLHGLPVEVTIIDINLEMIVAMNKFVPKAESDIIVRGSWIENPLADNYFDAVVGDLTWANVPREQWAAFHATIARVLKPSGLYIQRVTVIPEGWQFQSAETIVRQYAALPYTPQRHFELFFHLLTDSYDLQTQTISLESIRKSLSPMLKHGAVVPGKRISGAARLLKRLFAFWGDAPKQWQTGYPKELRTELASRFTFIEESVAEDYLCAATAPLWVSRVKK